MSTLTWLHLSDWHQQGEDFDRNIVRNALLKDIANRNQISPNLTELDFIAFSGDIAYAGQAAEYQAAIKYLFEPLLVASKVNRDRLFIVPGNHDLDWSVFDLLPAQVTQPFHSDSEVRAWLTNQQRRERLLEPFKNYEQFMINYLGQEQVTYASVRSFEAAGTKIGLLGLNSALMCGRNKDSAILASDKRTLVVGEPQINNGLSQIADARVRIAMLHHPFDWLSEFDQYTVENRLKENCHFVLCGHQHTPDIQVIRDPGVECVIIPAGACYERRVPENLQYTNAYNFVHLDFFEGKGVIYLRQWSERQGIWIPDTYAAREGCYEFELPNSLKLPASVTPEPLRKDLLPFKRVCSPSDTPKCHEYLQKLALNARRVVLIGTGLNILHDLHFQSEFLNSIANDQSRELEIYLADPDSPAVITRLIEEETGDTPPSVGHEGLIKRLKALLDQWSILKSPKNISIKLFTNYPTFALLILDDYYFFYPYGYTRLGNFSPVLGFAKEFFEDDAGVIDFLDRQYQLIKTRSLDANTIYESRYQKKRMPEEKLYPFALYFVPREGSALYEFGSKILGYDVRNKRHVNQFDVFLSHNSKDKPAVRQLAQELQARGLQVWLDEEQLVPGRPWQEALEKIIQTAHTAAILVGKDGRGPWEISEMRACLSEFVDRHLPVIPVLLPSAPVKPELPLFLRAFTWIDLRGGLTEDSLYRLEWGITGVKPGQSHKSPDDTLCSFSSWIKVASNFGFHLTLCDVVYFLHEAEIRSVIEEVKFIAKSFTPFELTHLKVHASFPDNNSIAILMEDPTRSLEAFHHELVHRIYRRAAASNYTLDLAKQSRGQGSTRNDLICNRYHAPYILNKYKPHFTLLDNVGEDQQERLTKKLDAHFKKMVLKKERYICVEKLAVMSRSGQDATWVIINEIPLGGNND